MVGSKTTAKRGPPLRKVQGFAVTFREVVTSFVDMLVDALPLFFRRQRETRAGTLGQCRVASRTGENEVDCGQKVLSFKCFDDTNSVRKTFMVVGAVEYSVHAVLQVL